MENLNVAGWSAKVEEGIVCGSGLAGKRSYTGDARSPGVLGDVVISGVRVRF